MKNKDFERWWNDYYHQSMVSMQMKNFMLDAFEAGYKERDQANNKNEADAKRCVRCGEIYFYPIGKDVCPHCGY